jgi:hypothetical protein
MVVSTVVCVIPTAVFGRIASSAARGAVDLGAFFDRAERDAIVDRSLHTRNPLESCAMLIDVCLMLIALVFRSIERFVKGLDAIGEVVDLTRKHEAARVSVPTVPPSALPGELRDLLLRNARGGLTGGRAEW